MKSYMYIYSFLLIDKYIDNEHSLMVQRNYMTLVDNLDVDCGHLLDRLYEAGALTGREMAAINAKSTKHEKSETLLDLVSKFSPANFEIFLQALEDSSQEHVASIMTGKLCKYRYTIKFFHLTFVYHDNVHFD